MALQMDQPLTSNLSSPLSIACSRFSPVEIAQPRKTPSHRGGGSHPLIPIARLVAQNSSPLTDRI
jgi:hypothetical protein